MYEVSHVFDVIIPELGPLVAYFQPSIYVLNVSRLTFLGENNYAPAWLCGSKYCYLLVLPAHYSELDTRCLCGDCID